MAEATDTNTETQTETAQVETKVETKAAPVAGESLIPDSAKTETTTEFKRPDKFKTDADGWKAYTELEKKIGQKQAPVYEAPEQYDFTELQEQGLAFENEEHQAAVQTMLKDGKIPQDMLKALAPISKDLTDRAFRMGQAKALESVRWEPVDKEKETAALRAEWGDNFETELKAVADFTTKLPRELFTAPLDGSAAGLKFLREYQKAVRGADFITDSTPLSGDGGEARKAEIMTDPVLSKAYFDTTSKKGEALRKEVLAINARKHGEKL